jgi:hypothetical protein
MKRTMMKSCFISSMFLILWIMLVRGDNSNKTLCWRHKPRKRNQKPVQISPFLPSSIPPIPERNKDPRHYSKCRAVFGASDTSISVNTVEDYIASELGERSPRVRKCSMLFPYGGFAYPTNNFSLSILWVEIPKCATTTIKTWWVVVCHA